MWEDVWWKLEDMVVIARAGRRRDAGRTRARDDRVGVRDVWYVGG